MRAETRGTCAAELCAIVERGKFVTNRTLAKYLELMPKRFSDELRGLGQGEHWVDMGSGLARPQAAYGASDPRPRYPQQYDPTVLETLDRIAEKPVELRARTTAITARGFETDVWWGPAYLLETPSRPPRLLAGRLFEDLSDAEIGRANLITDVFGIFAYAPQPDEVLRRYLGLIEDRGGIYIFLAKDGYAARSPVTLASGEETSLAGWLLRQGGLDIELMDACRGPYNRQAVVRIQKRKGENPKVSHLMLDRTTALDSPPLRAYHETQSPRSRTESPAPQAASAPGRGSPFRPSPHARASTPAPADTASDHP